MSRLILFNKPFQVLCQFSDKDGRPVLADFIKQANVYPAGRLDNDSEGLLLLTDDGQLQSRIADPRWKLPKTYWAQVEGDVTEAALEKLRCGVELNDGHTLPAEAEKLTDPDLWPRLPPIRYRANIPSSWIALTIREGRNRQVRRMTAAVGFPTLRLVRVAVGPWRVDGLAPGEYKEITVKSGDIPGFSVHAGDSLHAAASHGEHHTSPGRHRKSFAAKTTGTKPSATAPTKTSDQRPLRRLPSTPPKAPPRSPTPSSRKGRAS